MTIDYKAYIKQNSTTLIFILIVLIVLFLVYFSTKMYFSQRDNLKSLTIEVEDLKNKQSVVQVNESLTANEIDSYNALLQQLIPEKEDYFSIIYALENLSRETGFVINQYTISVSDTSGEKLSLLVEGDGDTEAFLNLLQDYRYIGGRLITNENISFTSDIAGRIKLSFNFYAKQTPLTNDSVAKISQQDINLMREIQRKTVVSLIPPSEEVAEYEIAESPF